MGVRLMTQKRITGSYLSDATHQDGSRIGLVSFGSGNTGDLRPVLSGSSPPETGIEIEILESGDVGTATYKWREGSGTWQGRDTFHGSTWGAFGTAYDNSTRAWGTSSHNPMGGLCQAEDGTIILTFSYDDSDGDSYASVGVLLGTYDVSLDNITWGSIYEAATSASADCTAGKPITLKNGRILFTICEGSSVDVMASDDDGSTWFTLSTVTGVPYLKTIAELSNGNIIGAYVDSSANFYSTVSTDGGASWGTATAIVTPSSLYYAFDLLVLQNGNILFAYADNDTYDPVKAYISSNGGSSWSSATDIMAASSMDLSDPSLFLDISGRVFCVATRDNGFDDEIAIAYSDDNGGSWTYSEGVDLYSSSGDDISNPSGIIVHGYKAVCAALHLTSGGNYSVDTYDGGSWNTYSAGKEIPCAINFINQYFTDTVKCLWEGGGGIDGDTYAADAIYDYSAKNMVDYDTPGRPWRTSSDDITVDDVDAEDVDAEGSELVTNGDAELDSDWSSFGTPTTEERSSEQAHGGTYSRKFVADSAGDGTQAPTYTTSTGTGYKVSIWTYSATMSGGGYNHIDVKIVEGDGSGYVVEESFTTLAISTWNEIEIAYVETSGGSSARVICASPSTMASGTWYIDDVSVKPASPACYTKWDFTAIDQQVLNGVAFFGCNVRTITFEGHTSDSWESPDIDETVSFDIANGTGAINGSPSGNIVPVTSNWAANHKDHSLSKKYFRATSGTDSGLTWEIKDNVGTNLFLEISAATNLANTDTFAIFDTSAVAFFTAATVRYIRPSIPPQQTANGCYQIGTMIPFGSSDLSRGWAVGYSRPTTVGITNLETPDGSIFPVISRTQRIEWGLSYSAQALEGDVLEAVKYAIGYSMVLVPDDDDARPIPHLLHLLGDIDQSHLGTSLYKVDIRLIEQPTQDIEDYTA